MLCPTMIHTDLGAKMCETIKRAALVELPPEKTRQEIYGTS